MSEEMEELQSEIMLRMDEKELLQFIAHSIIAMNDPKTHKMFLGLAKEIRK